MNGRLLDRIRMVNFPGWAASVIGGERIERAAADDSFAGSCGLLLAVLFADDVFGVPVRPVLIVLAAVLLFVLAMGGGRTAERRGEIGR